MELPAPALPAPLPVRRRGAAPPRSALAGPGGPSPPPPGCRSPGRPLGAAAGLSRQALAEPLAVAKLSHFPLGRAGQGLFKLAGARCK